MVQKINCKFCNALTFAHLKCSYCGQINEQDRIAVLKLRMISLLEKKEEKKPEIQLLLPAPPSPKSEMVKKVSTAPTHGWFY